MIDASRVAISLELGCSERCDAVSRPLLSQLRLGNYGECSVLEIPEDVAEWSASHRTARRRAGRAARRGYIAKPLQRELHADEIHAINTSAERRQGRRMSRSYLEREQFSPLPEYECDRHAIRATGVWETSSANELALELVGYLVMYRAGDLALVSQILGHAAHLENEIMYLLFATALERETQAGPGVVVYNRHDSGTDGLRFYKERCGFSEAPVEWLP